MLKYSVAVLSFNPAMSYEAPYGVAYSEHLINTELIGLRTMAAIIVRSCVNSQSVWEELQSAAPIKGGKLPSTFGQKSTGRYWVLRITVNEKRHVNAMNVERVGNYIY